MLNIKYQFTIPGQAVEFYNMIRQFNESTESAYLALIPELYDFKTNTIHLKISTLPLFSKIIDYNDKFLEVTVTFEKVLSKCKELYKCYLQLEGSTVE